MKIKLKYLVYFQIIYNFFIKFLISDFKFPGMLNYVTDVINVLLLLGVLVSIKKNNIHKIKIKPLIFPLILFIINLISFIVDFSNPLLFIWGARNVFRFFVFFYSCIYVLRMEDIKKIFDILEVIYIINFVICIYEFLVRGIKFDNLGGIFGNMTLGGNGPLNVLVILMDIYVLILYFNKKRTLKYLIFVILSSLIIASLAELKIVFFEMILLLIFMLVFIKRNFKMLFIIGSILLLGSFALKIYASLYPNSADFLNIEYVQEYALNSSYGSATDINRLSVISMINERFFRNNLKYKIIGMGLGNAETSQFKILNSRFYRLYGNTFKYNWFSHAFMYLESGYLGLLIYMLFFIKIVYDSFKLRNRNEYIMISFIFSIYTLIFLFYNQTLRIETMGYMIFLVLGIPYIFNKEAKNNEKNSNSDNESWI